MAKNNKRILPIHWPMGGVVKRHGFQNQAPYTTVDALNVRPDSSLGGRERGGSRPGLAKFFSQQLGAPSEVRGLTTITWVASGTLKSRLLAISNGKLYREEPVGTMELAATTGGTLKSDRVLHMAERNQLVYIADHSTVAADSITPYYPKVFDPAANTITSWISLVTDGTMPTGSDCICLWRDRMVLGGGTTTPHGLFMSRQSDPYDWDYSEDDSGAAVSLTLSQAGQIGDVITALSPHSDNCLIIGCLTSLWIVRGDPGLGGQVDNLSPHLGIIDKGAYCVTPEGLLIFLSQDGLYQVPASCEAAHAPESLSRERLPRELLAVDRTVTQVSMAYDVEARGVHLFLTPITATGTAATHWFFDWETKSFWQVQHADEDFDPFVVHSRRNYYDDDSYVALGCRDGYIRRYLHATQTDDGTAFSSYVFLGPFGDPTMYADAMITELCATLGTSSGDVNWEIRSGNSPEEAFSNTALWSGTWTTAGRNHAQHPRARGQSLYLKISNGETGVYWAWEGGYLILMKLGRTRP